MLASNERPTEKPSFSLAVDIVELVVLTTDEAFLQTLRDAVGQSSRVWHVASADQVGGLLIAGQVGILVVDGDALYGSTHVLMERIKRQFPDLVLLGAGDREAENALAGLISSGVVYRFIHKPVSPARARLFADAAVRKFGEHRRRVALRQPAVGGALSRPALLTGTLSAAVLVAVVIAWIMHPASSRDAGTALLATPGGEAPVAQSEYSGGAALAAGNDVRERLLMRAESALLEERLDQAAAAIVAARQGGVEHGQIAFLAAQLANARERQKLGQQRRLRGGRPASEKPDEELESMLSLAAKRLQEGRLAEPDGDSAKFYVQEALRISPDNNAASSAKEILAMALMSEVHLAIEHRDFRHAVSLLDAADGIASQANVDNLSLLLRTARRDAAPERSRAGTLAPPDS